MKQKDGFSIFELTIIVSMLSILIGSYADWSSQKLKANIDSLSITYARINTIKNRIADYVNKYGRLPCPSNKKVQPNGIHVTDPGNTTYHFGEEDLVIKDYKRYCNDIIGSVPIYNLKLPESYIQDGWGNRFTYRISANLCSSNITHNVAENLQEFVGCTRYNYKNGINNNKLGDITIKDGNKNVIASNIAFVIMSHGANMYGGYTINGTQIANTSSNSLEVDNSSHKSDNSTKTYYLDDSFDDILGYYSKEDIKSLIKQSIVYAVSKADCYKNSQAIKDITTSISSDFDTYIDSYEADDQDSKVINKGSQVIMSILWSLQQVCVDYYGTASSGDWIGVQCPYGKTYNNNKCT